MPQCRPVSRDAKNTYLEFTYRKIWSWKTKVDIFKDNRAAFIQQMPLLRDVEPQFSLKALIQLGFRPYNQRPSITDLKTKAATYTAYKTP